jgi:hypothetical protein
MNQIISVSCLAALVLGISVQWGQTYEIARRPWYAWMEVVEPKGKSHEGVKKEVANADIQPASDAKVPVKTEAMLTPEEQAKALLLRMEAQRALRTFKAKKMAQNRRNGKAAWKRELEGFLTAQRKIERDQVKPVMVPTLKRNEDKKRSAPEWRPVRKGRAVLT